MLSVIMLNVVAPQVYSLKINFNLSLPVWPLCRLGIVDAWGNFNKNRQTEKQTVAYVEGQRWLNREERS
jgi:hypothetical protein